MNKRFIFSLLSDSCEKMTDKIFDYIIVGQGIAGTNLAFQLIDSGKSIMVIDQVNLNSSSRVATGIINPVTGRKNG